MHLCHSLAVTQTQNPNLIRVIYVAKERCQQPTDQLLCLLDSFTVQGGSWHNQPPKVLFSSSIGGVMSTSSIPRNWGSQGLVDDMTMLTEARLMGSVVKVSRLRWPLARRSRRGQGKKENMQSSFIGSRASIEVCITT